MIGTSVLKEFKLLVTLKKTLKSNDYYLQVHRENKQRTAATSWLTDIFRLSFQLLKG